MGLRSMFQDWYVPMSGQSPALLFGQDLRPRAEQGVGLCLVQERFQQRYLTCHYLLMDQADGDPIL